MQLRPIGRAVLRSAHPFAVLRIVVQPRAGCPALTAVLAAEQTVRRLAGVPRARLARMSRLQPERMVDAARRGGAFYLRKRRRLLRLHPAAAEVVGAEDRRPQVSRARRGEQRAPVARIEHQVMDDVAEEMRAVHAPGPPRRIAPEQPCSLARRDEHDHPRRRLLLPSWMDSSCHPPVDPSLRRSRRRYETASTRWRPHLSSRQDYCIDGSRHHPPDLTCPVSVSSMAAPLGRQIARLMPRIGAGNTVRHGGLRGTLSSN